MNGGNLVVNSEGLKTLASTTSGYVGELQTKLNEIINLNGDISGSWIGSAASSYTNKVTEQQAAIQSMIDTLNSICETMTSIANNYEAAESAIASAVGGN